MQKSFFNESLREKDIVYTPKWVVLEILKRNNLNGIVLDPCKGDGAFYDNIKQKKEYCEIEEGLDFFDYKKKVDWVIGNPPYSIFLEFLQHSMNISESISFLVPINKVFQRQIIMDRINKWGYISQIIVFGSGQLIDFPFGFSVANFVFKKGKKKKTEIIMGINEITYGNKCRN